MMIDAGKKAAYHQLMILLGDRRKARQTVYALREVAAAISERPAAQEWWDYVTFAERPTTPAGGTTRDDLLNEGARQVALALKYLATLTDEMMEEVEHGKRKPTADSRSGDNQFRDFRLPGPD